MPTADEGGASGLRYAYLVSGEGPAPASLEVTIELPRGGPERWWLEETPRVAIEVTAVDEDGEVTRLELDEEGMVELPDSTRAVRYAYPIGEVLRRAPSLERGRGRVDHGYVLMGDAYLLRPARIPPGTRAELAFEGVDPVVATPTGADGGRRLYRYDLLNPGFHAYGGRPQRLTVEPAAGEGAPLLVDLVRLPGRLAAPDEVVTGWIRRAASELFTYRDELPTERVLVTLVPVRGRRGEASPFGYYLWSRSPSLVLLVSGRAEAADFADDWVAIHELSHMMHPNFRPKRPWLSEGLATYYQTVARMRSGRLSAREGWRRLSAGVHRGRGWDETLADLSTDMRRRRAYMPVYWGGALFALDVDLTIRRRTDGERSLDDVLALLAARGLTAEIEDFRQAVDEVAGAPVVGELIERHLLAGPALAPADAVLAELGIGPDPSAFALDAQAPAAGIRAAIAAGR